MYFVRIDDSQPIAHATLEGALKTLRSELRAREAQGYEVSFNDKLEFEVHRRNGAAGAAAASKGNGISHRLWIEDESGQNVTSRDASEAG